jgi:divinyl chlorophyllide a 8-vinyl-reductase
MSQLVTQAEKVSARVLVLGATGTVGRTVAAHLARSGADVVCVVRQGSPAAGQTFPWCDGATVRSADLGDPGSVARDAFRGERFDAVVSCLASRSGAPADARAVDHDANLNAMQAAGEAQARRFLLVSAICVQKPRLAFQFAKLDFEAKLAASGLDWTVIRPTALFKSLSGQVARVRAGRPFLVFGDGQLTACKPISDADLGRFVLRCLADDAALNRILPVGGPGPAITPLDQAAMLGRLLGRDVPVRRVPVALISGIAGGLGVLGRVNARMADRAEFARIGHYYATESMLVWDHARLRYSPEMTPEFGDDQLLDHYARLIRGDVVHETGEHSVF